MAITKFFIISVLILFGKFEARAYDFECFGRQLDGKMFIHGVIKNCHHGRLSNSIKDLDTSAQMELKFNKPRGTKSLKNSIKLHGKPLVTDGDTIKFGKTRVRLFGIDAPEIRQKCIYDQKAWNCGLEAHRALEVMVGQNDVFCEQKDADRYGRIVAVCKVKDIDLNATMVREGWALAYRRYSNDYIDEESIAKSSKLGVWRGSFRPPWSWRKNKRINRKN